MVKYLYDKNIKQGARIRKKRIRVVRAKSDINFLQYKFASDVSVRRKAIPLSGVKHNGRIFTQFSKYRFKVLRMRQEELAEVLGWSERNVRHYEGDRPMTLRVARRVAKLLECHVRDIWTLKDFKIMNKRGMMLAKKAAERKAEIESYGYTKIGNKIV